jgi:hypothetical protein
VNRTLFRVLSAAALTAVVVTHLSPGWGDEVGAPATFPTDAPSLTVEGVRFRVRMEGPAKLGEQPVALVEVENRTKRPQRIRRRLDVTTQLALAISRVPMKPTPQVVQSIPLELELAPGKRRVLRLPLLASLTSPDQFMFGEYSLEIQAPRPKLESPNKLRAKTNPSKPTLILSSGPVLTAAKKRRVLARFRVDNRDVLRVESTMADGHVLVSLRNTTKVRLSAIGVHPLSEALKLLDAKQVKKQQLTTLEPGESKTLRYRLTGAAKGELWFMVEFRGLVQKNVSPTTATK